MTECYEVALAANTTTLFYVLISLLIEFVLSELASLIASRWMTRRDRKRIEKLMADTEAELRRYPADKEN